MVIDTRTTTDLDALAVEIRSEHERAEAAFQTSVHHAIRAGKLLTNAKTQVGHGGWLDWLEHNFPAGKRTAQGYMRLARHAEDAQAVAHLGIAGSLRALAAPRANHRGGEVTVETIASTLDEAWEAARCGDVRGAGRCWDRLAVNLDELAERRQLEAAETDDADRVQELRDEAALIEVLIGTWNRRLARLHAPPDEADPFAGLIPPLDLVTEAKLRESIRRFGVLVPVVKDQHGRIIDGRHRARIADEEGVKYDRQIITVSDDEEAREIAATLNVDRAHGRRALEPEGEPA